MGREAVKRGDGRMCAWKKMACDWSALREDEGKAMGRTNVSYIKMIKSGKDKRDEML